MVNVEDFAKRLKIIIDYYEISAALLAEKINVQRSSISHILSGRNKPSLDFVLKILKAFPEVELYWLLNGVGNFPKETVNVSSAPALDLVDNQNTAQSTQTKATTSANIAKEIERIVIFYTDGTFKNYTS